MSTTPPEIEEPYQPHISAADHARHERRVSLRRRTNLNPTPGPLRLAFAPVPLRVAGLALPPVTLQHFVLLQWIASPLLLQLAGEDATLSTEQVLEALFLLSRNARLGTVALARGREAFTQEACDCLGDGVPLREVPEVGRALLGVLRLSFSTAVGYRAARQESGGGMVSTMDFEGGSEDGLGWMIQLVACMGREFGWSMDHVLNDLPLVQAVALQASATESNPWGQVEREGDGYIAQEIQVQIERG